MLIDDIENRFNAWPHHKRMEWYRWVSRNARAYTNSPEEISRHMDTFEFERSVQRLTGKQ